MHEISQIVAVDDSPIILRMIERMMGDFYELHLFSSGARALQYLKDKDRTPDLIILDIEMPEMDGYDVLEQINKVEHLKNVPVIFLTSNNNRDHVLKAVADGAKDYVIKPVEEVVLLNKIHTLLGDKPVPEKKPVEEKSAEIEEKEEKEEKEQ